MDLPTYTNIWRIEKRLYKLYDFRLPMPLPVGTFGVALGVFALWVILLSILNAPFAFGNGWHLVMWVVPPGVITVLATRPVIEGKRLTELLISQARFLTEARVYTRLAPEYEPAEVRVSVRVWHRDPEAGPLPVVGRRRVERAAVEPERVAVEDTAVGPEAAPPLVGLPVRAAEPAASPEEYVEHVGNVGGVETDGADGAPVRPEPVEAPAGEPEPEPERVRAHEPEPERRPEPARQREPERAPERVRGRERAPERERVPVAAAALSAHRVDHATAGLADEPSHTAPDESRDDGTAGRRRGVGRRVLNYFGFGLGSAPPEPQREATGGDDAFEDFDEEDVHTTEDDERSDNQDWFARLRSSSGETPVGLTSKSAYSTGDTGAMSREDLADAIAEPDHDRRRAEEVMAAPESADDESPAARRLRGRVQGIRVTRDLEERRSDQAPERAPEPPRARARGQALPAREEADAPEPPRRRGRPHAAPWELDRGADERRGSTGQADLSDYAARFAAATGRPAAPEPAAAPWLPPSAATPAPEAESGPVPEAAEGGGEAPPEGAAAPTGDDATSGPAEDARGAAGAPAEDAVAPTGESGSEQDVRGGEEARSGARPETAAPTPSAKPPLEIDHGTGEQAALPPQPNEGTEARGPEWAEHMSVLDQHLITADTPAPPRPRFADVVPAEERAADDPGEWFDDGKKRHPDQPKVGDRDNPVIPARELREKAEAEAAAENTQESGLEEPAEAPGEAKPPTQLDHGTGELVSFVEVRDEPSRAAPRRKEGPDAGAPAEEGAAHGTSGGTTDTATGVPAAGRSADGAETGEAERTREAAGATARRTAEDLAAAEAAALARRRAAVTGRPVVKDPRANPSMASTLGGERGAASVADPGAASARGSWSDPSTTFAPSTASDRDAASAPGTAPDRDTSSDPGAGSAPSAASNPGSASARGTASAPDSTSDPDTASDRHAASDRGTSDPSARPDSGTESASGGASASSTASDRDAASAQGTSLDRGTSDPSAESAQGAASAPGATAGTASVQGAAPTSGTGSTADGTEVPAGDAPQAPGEHDPHDGVFHRVAQNARRLGQLFGQPVPGEEPAPGAQDAAKPELELDHGTGEQDRLGDTPNGVPTHRPEPRPVEREEPASDSGGTRGWRRLAKVVTGGAAPLRSDLPASDIERLRTPLDSPRGLVVLGCTGGAGQTVTTLMIGHTLAAHRDDRVVAVDVNPGPNGLSRRVGAQSPETLTALLANADTVEDYAHMRSYASRAGTGLEVVQTLDDPYVQTLDERDYTQLTRLLGGFYSVTLLDPAATGVARSLPGADGLVLVAPASADAERAVSMTFDWLDGNGYGALRANAVLVVNGVSKRSLGDVDAAERVARGRCRAIVRIPWDDHLGSSYTRIDVGALRPATKRAHGALGGVLVNVLTGAR
ncbi:TcpE family conjugal transfer membrane protein [Nocardiopsis sp. NRRL B-16309]|uniref:TcpE family conjugal transfer membrane protein n=1 Tax=Nocardiopsis sp. NRRL B-16309 TaxID=1519494 RepID=UPI0006B0109F|nr:TcpE family conjugal transfer membrane protein [Nocardiopsis sp. NRRL B-16309]